VSFAHEATTAELNKSSGFRSRFASAARIGTYCDVPVYRGLQRRKTHAEETRVGDCRSGTFDVYGQRRLLHRSGKGDEEVQSR
jgi:hypothetical protein